MTDKITESITPTDLDPVPFDPLAGDWKDDDAPVYEGDFQAADHTALPKPPRGVPHTVDEIDPCTRIITRVFSITGDGTNAPDPVQVLPRDPHRTKLFVICTTTFGWQFGSQKSDVYGAPIMSGNGSTTGFDLSGHTGALWIYTSSPTVNLGIKVWAVSK